MSIAAAAQIASSQVDPQSAANGSSALSNETIIVTGTRFSGTRAEDSVEALQVVNRSHSRPRNAGAHRGVGPKSL